jgi:hypothetical protein
MRKLSKKQYFEIKNGEISLCSWCNSMTKTILDGERLICGKCKKVK